MKYLVIYTLILNAVLFGATEKSKSKERTYKQIQIEMEKEKKYAEEGVFYQEQYYDFEGAEVNPDSLDSVPELELDDLDMDSVYD